MENKYRYMIKQNRQLYQLFPDDNGNVGYAIPIPGRNTLDDTSKIWNQYSNYRSQNKIDSIENMINDNFSYNDIMDKLDL